jgi:signal transduction histidine kinase
MVESWKRKVPDSFVFTAKMPKGGRLTIISRATSEEVRVHVRDTGIGIPKERVKRLFQPHFTTKAQGLGLGLPICKRIIEAHGGRIEVRSKVGRGTTVTFTLPAAIGR